jgi:hypothetical protein
MTVAELLSRVSSYELSEWQAFEKLEPFGSEAGYVGHAIVAKTIADVNRGKDQKSYELSDFMPDYEGEEEGPQTEREMLQIAMTATIGLGGKDLRRVKD